MGSSSLGFMSDPLGYLTGGRQGDAAMQAGQIQSDAAGRAINQQNQMFNQATGYLSPYQQMGSNALTALGGMQPFSFSGKDLQNTPGYQFALDQGERSLSNQYASRGLGYSGAQMMGAQQFATGLADQTYNQQLQNQMGIYQNNYNNLMGRVGMGMNAGNSMANLAMMNGNLIGNYLTGQGNAMAGGLVGNANARGNALNNLLGFGSQMAGMGSGMGGGGGMGGAAAGAGGVVNDVAPLALA